MTKPSYSVNIPVVINDNRLVFVFTDKYLLADSIDAEKHAHSFYEVHFFLEGHGSVSFENGTEVEFYPGMLLFVNPEVYHVQKLRSEKLTKYNFKFTVSDFKNKDDDILLPILQKIDKEGYLLAEETAGFAEMLKAINTELDNRHKGYKTVVASILSTMIIELCRRNNFGSVQETQYSLKNEAIPVDTAKIIDNFFDQNYNRNAKIEELCELVHLSRSQLNRTIKAMYGIPFKEKHTSTRLHYIRHLLKKKELSVTTVSQMSGFESASSFSNFFKHYENMSPLEYRKQALV